MTLVKVALPIVLLLALTACATKPIVDTKGLDQAQFEQDLAECTALAEQIDQGGTALKSAAAGAVIGGLFGAISGDIGRGAAFGGLSGGTVGALSGDQEKASIIRRCLENRGYTVLN